MDLLILVAGGFCAIAFTIHFASSITVIARRPGTTLPAVPPDTAGVSILRPVCGVENFIEQTLETTFRLEFPRYEIVFCVAGANDPVVPIVRALIAEYPDVDARLLIGNTEISVNPKLNNLVKGWNAARYDWVVMVDSNVLMPKDHIQRMLSAWRPDTGLVCSPPIGGVPQGLWAELECAFLNTYQARWQCFADSLGIGFAQGKTMLLRRDLLDRAGGIEALGGEIAEDAAATKIVRGCRLRVRLVTDPFMQPLGDRKAADVWRRQVRWARLRRDTFKPFFIPEIFAGGIFPIAAGTLVAAASGWAVTGAILPLVVAWYGAEALLAYGMAWHLSLRSVAIWMLRDALLPVLWAAGWLGNDFEWRGHAMTVADQGHTA